ncbi:sialidase family protein [Clostridium sp.]|uniref:sialidase family protein n=1 Tax=Clostridium sp. TaxID=1506 RepID=UPI0026199125|nr:sialidase family protein [Clostridium sp.]
MKTEPLDLFKPGDLGSQNFRIPALFTTKDGTIIASFEGILPTTLSEGTFNLVLEVNNDIEILNTVGKNTTLNGDIELGNSIIINKVIDKSELEKKIDKSVLQGLVYKVKETDSSKYIPSTWTQFENALKAANSILINESSTQEEVESSYNTLLKAYLELRLAPDKSLLEGLIKEVQGIDLSKYTGKSVEVVEKALEDANRVLANEEAT